MSKIKAVDFAKYVNNEKEHLEHILIDQKKLPLLKNQSLQYYVSNTETLANSEEDYYYKRSSVSVAFEEEFDEDPLRAENGGQYQYCNYYLITNDFATSYIDHRSMPTGISEELPFIVKTSDGQEFTVTSRAESSNITITWDTSKDTIVDDDGEILRWVKTYCNIGAGVVTPLSETEIYSNVISPVKYFIFDGGTNNLYGDYNYQNLNLSKYLKEVIYKNNVVEFSLETGNSPQNNINAGLKYLKYFKNTNPDAIIDRPIYQAYKIEHIELNISAWTGLKTAATNYMFTTGFNCIKTIIINNKNEIYTNRLLSDSNSLKQLLINKPIIYSSNYILGNYSYIIENLDLSKIKTTSSAAVYLNTCYNLKNLYVNNDWEYSLNLEKAYSLTEKSINDLLDKLYDYTSGTTHTITFSSYNQALVDPDKLTAAQNKNWTISFK